MYLHLLKFLCTDLTCRKQLGSILVVDSLLHGCWCPEHDIDIDRDFDSLS